MRTLHNAYIGTKTEVEAISGAFEGMQGYATDTNQFGTFNGSTWDWTNSSPLTGSGSNEAIVIWSGSSNLTYDSSLSYDIDNAKLTIAAQDDTTAGILIKGYHPLIGAGTDAYIDLQADAGYMPQNRWRIVASGVKLNIQTGQSGSYENILSTDYTGYIAIDGKLGINVDTPVKNLDVNYELRLASGSNSPGVQFYDDSDDDNFWIHLVRSSDYLNFKSDTASNILTIHKSGGARFFGTADPGANTLAISGDLNVVSGNNIYLYGEIVTPLVCNPTSVTLDNNTSGTITISRLLTKVDTYGAAASGNLDNISGGSTDSIIFLTTYTGTRTIVVRDVGVSGGNIQTAGSANFSMDSTYDTICLRKASSTIWVEMFRCSAG